MAFNPHPKKQRPPDQMSVAEFQRQYGKKRPRERNPRKALKKKTGVSRRDKAKAAIQMYARLRDADNQGVVKCITCNFRGLWNKGSIHGGHYRPADKNGSCFIEENINGQCKQCNKFGMQTSETIGIYAKAIDKKYGIGKADELTAKSLMLKKFTDLEYIAIEQHYKKLCKQIRAEKGL